MKKKVSKKYFLKSCDGMCSLQTVTATDFCIIRPHSMGVVCRGITRQNTVEFNRVIQRKEIKNNIEMEESDLTEMMLL